MNEYIADALKETTGESTIVFIFILFNHFTRHSILKK